MLSVTLTQQKNENRKPKTNREGKAKSFCQRTPPLSSGNLWYISFTIDGYVTIEEFVVIWHAVKYSYQ